MQAIQEPLTIQSPLVQSVCRVLKIAFRELPVNRRKIENANATAASQAAE